MSKPTSFRANLLMLIAAAIWGFAFVAQKKGMDFIGPFTFNAARFGLGTIVLIPVLWFFYSRRKSSNELNASHAAIQNIHTSLLPSIVLGFLLYCGIGFQQTGMIYTTAGKAGFITGLYVLFVPLLGLFVAKKVNLPTWLGVGLALFGMYLLSIKPDAENFWSLEYGDVLILCSAVFWSLHVLVADRFVQYNDALTLSFLQFGFCAIFSLITAIGFESIDLSLIAKAWVPIAYTGLLATALAFTLQMLAQKEAHPTHVAIIISMEGVFAVIGGYLLLSEVMTARMLVGCGLILGAMLLAQIPIAKKLEKKSDQDMLA
ncbi:MAG: DMT family transporter [Gammaproteobacteria bacterium]|nr:DMT family transporter [Gammaproteobacteria bacterium]NNC98242.1 DMT family transporter [Gammaproteobacteria bacterium]NNM14319.1 DMT family transporter [Gammaproteobacteria bacterium]